MNLTNGNIIYGRAGIASVITYTINGTKLGTGTSDQVLVNGQLSTINKAIYSASSKVTDIHTITLVNTSNSEVSGIVLFLNGTDPDSYGKLVADIETIVKFIKTLELNQL